MATRVDIESLAGYTVTRSRGKEAAAKLFDFLVQGSVDLFLDGVEVLSTAFLDQIVVELAAAQATEQVTFVTSNPNTVAKLRRIAAIREALLYMRNANSTERSAVVPGRPVTETVFSDRKVPALNQ